MKAFSYRPSAPVDLEEYGLAVKMLRGHRLEREILFQLVGRTRRYSELRSLLRGQNDNALTRSLSRLADDWGLVDRRTDASQRPPIDAYEINALGVHVLFAIDRLRPVQETAAIARAYFEAQSDPTKA